MKNYLQLLVCLFIGFHISAAQTYDVNQESELSSEDLIQSNILQYAVLHDFGIGIQKNTRSVDITGNKVFISQIGALNRAAVSVKSEASEIRLTQDGDENFAGLDYDVKTVITAITQKGNRNVVFDIVKDRNADVALDLEQQGDNLNFQRLGTNTLTESLQFFQTEASPYLVIRSITNGNPNN